MSSSFPQNSPEQILPSLWRFTSGLKGMHQPCHGYILKMQDAFLLIDPPGDLTPRVVESISADALVTHIFVTHLQEEHVASAKHYPQAIIHVPAGDEYLCQGIESYERLITPWPEPWEWESRGNFQGHLGGAKNERPAAQALPLGESLRAGDRMMDMEVVSTPGHGKHAVTLIAVVDGRKVAFCGDLICEEGKLWNWFDCDWDYGPETGQRTLAASCRRLRDFPVDLLCPAHGEVLRDPRKALKCLEENILRVVARPEEPSPQAINFPESDSAAEGWRPVTPHIFQRKAGNNVIVVSSTGNALVIDDGLCIWEPLEKRVALHDAIFKQLKAALGIRKIEWIIPTHYHGDHTELIPHLAKNEGARIICLESISGPMEHPERYNLACPLPWYGTVSETIPIDQRVPEGFVLDWHEYQFRFFHLGGQTWFHLGLEAVVDGLRTLFVGDAFWGTAKTAQPVLCWNDAEPVAKGWIFALKRMIECKPDLLVCGHGSSLRDPLPYLQTSLKAWETRLNDYARLNARSTWKEFFSPFQD